MLRSAAVVPDMIYWKLSVVSKAETEPPKIGSLAEHAPTEDCCLNTHVEAEGIGHSRYLSVYLNIVNGVVDKVAAVYG
jgi:hypothetical protein